jgi:enediyne biosynthesis protein E4
VSSRSGLALVATLGWICLGLGAKVDGQIILRDVTEQSGLSSYEHFAGRTGKNYLVETITTGLVTFDYDGDGLIDIYLPNGAPLPGSQLGEQVPTNRLFRNLGDWRFVDVTEAAGVGDARFALGVIAADVDNDGDQDLVVANFGESILLENQGDGTFVSRPFAKSASYERIAAGLAMADWDGDGDLDLYIANYVLFDYREIKRQIFGVSVASGPLDFSPDFHTLLENTGDGAFSDVTQASGIGDAAGPGMGVVAFDYNGNGLVDIFVCNDSAANFLWENEGGLKFFESALLAGVAYGPSGAAQASMGADVGDVNRDGLLDLVVTNFSEEVPNVYLNSGDGFFDDVSVQMGLGGLNRPVTWGVGLSDFDNDGFLDLFIGAGHLGEHLEAANTANQARLPNYLMRNEQGVRFVEMGNASPDVKKPQITRGIAIDDLDQDGLNDVVILNMNDLPQLLRNETQQHGSFLLVELVGTHANRDAIGAVVTARLGEVHLLRTVNAGRGYQSCFGRRLHFGLDDAEVIDELTVQWPGGDKQVLRNVPVNCCIKIREGNDAYHLCWSSPTLHP